MNKILLCLIFFLPLRSWSKPPKIDDYYYSSNTRTSILKISQKDKKQFVELSVSHKSGCKGKVSGNLIKLSNITFKLDKKDSEGVCQLEITKIKRSYSVIENSCSDFHGPQCDFNMIVKK